MSEQFIDKIKNQQISSQVKLYINCIKTISDEKSTPELISQAEAYKTTLHLVWTDDTLNGEYHDSELAYSGKISGKTGFGKHPQVGLLKIMNYEVSNPNAEARKVFLDMIFNSVLPPIHSKQYMEEWDGPQSEGRLKKMANSISSFARNRIKTLGENDITVKKWQNDLEYIKKYHKDMSFNWPSTEIKE